MSICLHKIRSCQSEEYKHCKVPKCEAVQLAERPSTVREETIYQITRRYAQKVRNIQTCMFRSALLLE
jgi:hypothetical protein